MAHGASAVVMFNDVNNPISISPAYWFNRAKICGKNAANVSDFCGSSTIPDTSKPSAVVITPPLTPLNSQTFCAISAGDQSLFKGNPKIDPNASGRGTDE